MAQYKIGTVNVTQNSAIVTGVGTLWSANVSPGDIITVSGINIWYEIQTVNSNTQLTLASPYYAATQTDAPYAITRDFTPNNGYPYPEQGDIEVASLLKRALLEIDQANLPPGPFTSLTDTPTTYSGQGLRLVRVKASESGLEFMDPASLNTSLNFLALSDTPDAFTGQGQYVVRVNAAGTALEFVAPGAVGATTFLALTDTPSAFTGQAGRQVAVDSAGTALEFVASPYDVALYVPGKPGDGVVLLAKRMTRTVTFPAGLTASQGGCETAATAQAVFSLKKNGTEFGTATIAAAGTTVIFAASSQTVFSAGDKLTVVAPSPQDATLDGFELTLAGTRG